MPVVRIAVASTPRTATLADAVPAAIDAIQDASRLGAEIVCLPEAALPGHRSQLRHVPGISLEELDEAIAELAAAARRASVLAIVGAERPTPRGRELVAFVLDGAGICLGVQPKTQIDPSEEADYVAGEGRPLFETAGLTFGIAICHEAFRYPEIARSLVLGGAQVLFVPHFVTTEDGTVPSRWCDAVNPYNEKALVCRALENSVYVAAANAAGPDQGSITGIIDPRGTLIASVPYGEVGVVAADVDTDAADGRIARRWAPERSLHRGDRTP